MQLSDILLVVLGSIFFGMFLLVQSLQWLASRTSREREPEEGCAYRLIATTLLLLALVPYGLVIQHLFFDMV